MTNSRIRATQYTYAVDVTEWCNEDFLRGKGITQYQGKCPPQVGESIVKGKRAQPHRQLDRESRRRKPFLFKLYYVKAPIRQE